MRAPSRPAAATLIAAASLTSLAAAAVRTAAPQTATLARAAVSARHAAPRGPVGPRGRVGPAGQTGPAGVQGPAGPGPRVQSIVIDWQNGMHAGHDVATFTVPGIGSGEVKCSIDTQWIRLIPTDQGADTEMWAAIMRAGKLAVRAAARRSFDWGADYYLGLNQKTASTEEQEGHGQMRGIISTRGAIGASAPTNLAAPATFNLSWYWSFGDNYGPRCYVAGTVVTAGS